MVRKAAGEYSKTKEEQLGQAVKAAFDWFSTCYGAITIMYDSIVTVKFKMQKALRFLRKLLNKIEDLCLSLPVRSWSRIKHYHLYP